MSGPVKRIHASHIAKLAAMGMYDKEIADLLHCCPNSVAKIRLTEGIESGQSVSLRRSVEQVQELTAQGKTAAQIAEETGLSYASVTRYRRVK